MVCWLLICGLIIQLKMALTGVTGVISALLIFSIFIQITKVLNVENALDYWQYDWTRDLPKIMSHKQAANGLFATNSVWTYYAKPTYPSGRGGHTKQGLYTSNHTVPVNQYLGILTLLLNGDIHPNPGPNTRLVQYNICTKTIRRKQRNITCVECKMKYHTHFMGIDRNETQGHALCVFYPSWAHEEEGDMQPQNDEAHRYDEHTIRHSFYKIGECKGLQIVHLNIQGLRGSLDEFESSTSDDAYRCAYYLRDKPNR